MKSFALKFLSSLALAFRASAQYLTFSSPTSGTIWTAGDPNTSVTWTNSCNGTTGNTFYSIYLNFAVNGIQAPVPGVGKIGALNCSKPVSTYVTTPQYMNRGDTFTIVVDVDDGAYSSFSSTFSIKSAFPYLTGSTRPQPTTTYNPGGGGGGGSTSAGWVVGMIAGILVVLALIACFVRRNLTNGRSSSEGKLGGEGGGGELGTYTYALEPIAEHTGHATLHHGANIILDQKEGQFALGSAPLPSQQQQQQSSLAGQRIVGGGIRFNGRSSYYNGRWIIPRANNNSPHPRSPLSRTRLLPSSL